MAKDSMLMLQPQANKLLTQGQSIPTCGKSEPGDIHMISV